MRIQGAFKREKDCWIAYVPAFDLMSQGSTQKKSLSMIAGAFSLLLEDMDIDSETVLEAVQPTTKGAFVFVCKNVSVVLALILIRQRTANSLTLRDIAKIQGYKSHNAIAQYEQRKSQPSLQKLEEILNAMGLDIEITVGPSKAS